MPPTPPQLPIQLAAEIASRLGSDWSIVSLAATGRTYAVLVGNRIVAVVKMLRLERRPDDVRRVLETVRAHGIPCPALLGAAAGAACWFALFEHVGGRRPDRSCEGWASMWSAAFSTLRHLAELSAPAAPWDLESEWLQLVGPAAAEDDAAADLWNQLGERRPGGTRCLAHGDFAPQNFVLADLGLALIDWEDVGYARPGFDAGWLLSLNRVAAGPGWPQGRLMKELTQLGIAASNLRWFEGLGLLRMHARAHAWDDRPVERDFVLETVRSEIREYLAVGRSA
jgi:Ser/Thr protein kinase RdoA (MazF antagonist)